MYEVSIIIPVYNVAEYVGISLQSALNQSFKSIEFIIVNDCTEDDSIAIINKILENHPRKADCKIINHEKNRGLSSARNTGLKHAIGKYVFFLDSDDEISSSCIEEHYNKLLEDNSDFTIANVKLVGSKSIHISNISSSLFKEMNSPLQLYLTKVYSTSAWNKLYKMKMIKDYNLTFVEGLLYEDILWSFNVAKVAKKVSCITSNTYIYNIRNNSITTNKHNYKKIDSLLYTLKTLREEYLFKLNLSNSYSFEYFYNYWRFNTAIFLINYDGGWDERIKYYKEIQSLKICKLNNKSLYSFCLQLPFYIFYTTFSPAYYLYKKAQRILSIKGLLVSNN